MTTFDEQFQKFAEALPGMLHPREAEARAVLKEAVHSSATALITALRTIYGEESLKWECETIWVTLERDGFPLENLERDKIQAAISLLVHPSFYWDNLAFQRIAQALNGQPFDASAIQEVHAAHMSWAVYEASVIRNLDSDEKTVPEFDEDVQQYVAVCLRREGYVYPPEVLRFAEDGLEKMLAKDSSGLKKEVKQAWGHLDKTKLAHTEFAENEHGVQLAKLAACYLYQQERADHLAQEVVRLGVKTS
jgi:hypothetical protein